MPNRAPPVALLVCLCAAACHSKQESNVLLHVSSTVPVTDLEFHIRDVDYDWVPTLPYKLDNRDITHQPLQVLLEPSSVIKDRFFVQVKGFFNGTYVAMDSNILLFKTGQQLSTNLQLQGQFTDDDDDGFVLCAGGPLCDCVDHNDHVNPFTRANCNDDIDNDCSGPPLNKGCPCSVDYPTACTNLPPSLQANAGVGACYFGTLLCRAGQLDTACDSGQLSTEVPSNYSDDDCDGSVDEGSPCTPGAVRPCHLGFVDDPANPNPDERLGASKRALGLCGDANQKPFGSQACARDINGSPIWGGCDNDVLPQRNTRPGQTGWAEIPSNASTGAVGQCDGLDNDCNGITDDAPEFDADRDSYKICGTDAKLPTPPRLSLDMVDCNDANPKINPSATEICGNAIDEDCRCDHDPQGLPQADPNSEIGKPSVSTSGAPLCPDIDQYLRCNVLPRSDAAAVGSCKDGPDAYYAGNYGGNQDCYVCPLAYGLSCNPATGSCSQKATDCAQCAGSAPGDNSTVAATRPLCKNPSAQSCRGTTGPTWADINNADPFNECSGVACAGYYDSIKNGRCYAKSDVAAATVNCKSGGQCQINADVCPGSSAQATPVAQPVCVIAASGCSGSTAPSFVAQPFGQDMFAECTSGFTCSDASNGGPYFFGISSGVCYYRGNIGTNACNGSSTLPACRSRADACGGAGKGDAVAGRPLCQQASGGCGVPVGNTPPTYNAVSAGTDPFNECSGADCDGSGHCQVPQGGTCSSAQNCSGGLQCVDGFCCASSCGGTCMACSNALTGQANGTCAVISKNTTDSTCSGTCEANTGICKTNAGGNCFGGSAADDAGCITGHCECTDAACSSRACAPAACSCRYDSNEDGSCDGFLNANVNDACASSQACDGAGTCKTSPGGSCSANNQCVGTCIGGICQAKGGSGGTCDAGDNADCVNGTCSSGHCN